MMPIHTKMIHYSLEFVSAKLLWLLHFKNQPQHNGQLPKVTKNSHRVVWKLPPTLAQPSEHLIQREILFLGKMSLLLFYFIFLTQTVDFSSPGPKEFDYFCFKQYKGDTIVMKNILTDFGCFKFYFLGYVFRVVNCV